MSRSGTSGVSLDEGTTSANLGTTDLTASSTIGNGSCDSCTVPDRILEGSPNTAIPGNSENVQLAGSGGTPGSRGAQQAQFRAIVREIGLSPGQAQLLHREISGQNLGYHQVKAIAREIKIGYPNK